MRGQEDDASAISPSGPTNVLIVLKDLWLLKATTEMFSRVLPQFGWLKLNLGDCFDTNKAFWAFKSSPKALIPETSESFPKAPVPTIFRTEL